MEQPRIAKKLLWGAIIGGSVTLAGCGGGGGGSTNTASNGGTSANTMTITSTNAPQLASTVFTGSSLSQLTGQVQSLKSVSTTSQTPNVMGIVAQMVAQDVKTYGASAGGVAPATSLASRTSSGTCTSGGTLTVTVNEANPSVGLQAGDSIVIQASSCTEPTSGSTITMDGMLTETVSAYNTTSTGSQAAITLDAGNFTVTDPAGDSESMNGSLTAAVTLTSSPDNTTKVELTSAGFTIAGSFGGVQSSLALQSLDYWVYGDSTTGAWQFSENVAMSYNGQTFSVNTTTPFSGSGCAYPTAGSATFIGANGSGMVVTAESNGQTALQVTSNGSTSSQTVNSSQVFSLICY